MMPPNILATLSTMLMTCTEKPTWLLNRVQKMMPTLSPQVTIAKQLKAEMKRKATVRLRSMA